MTARKKKQYFLIYTAAYIITAFFCLGIWLLLYSKAAMRIWDSFDQHYQQYIYIGNWIRNALTKGEFTLWEPAIGYGADAILTMSNGFFDPFYWLSAIIPARFSEYGFAFMVFAKLYCAGLSFSIFALSRKHEPYAVLCGAIIYTFCACAYTGMYQSGFINPMYLFPLLVLGTDRLFDENRPALYVGILVFTALGSFYFTYMSVVLVIGYCIIKWFFQTGEKKTARLFFRTVGRFILYSLLAAGISAIAWLPLLKVMTGMGRLDVPTYLPAAYDFGTYANMYKGLIATYDMWGRDCKIGFSTLAIICVFGVFLTGKKEYRKLKIEFLLMATGLCIPFVGHVMNGFGYIANRWIWAFALLIGYMAVVAIPNLNQKNLLRASGIIALTGIYITLAYTVFCAGGKPFLVLSIVMGALALSTLLLGFIPSKVYKAVIPVLTCITVFVPAYFEYSDRYGNAYVNNITLGDAYRNSVETPGLPMLTLVNTSDGTRYQTDGLPMNRNASWLYGVSGIDFYMNIYDSNVDQFHNDMALRTYAWNYGYNGVDRREELLTLLGVNHYIKVESKPSLPRSFKELEAEKLAPEGLMQSWAPENRNSLFYRYPNAVSYADYEKLSPYERQQVLMKACVTDQKDADIDPASISTAEEKIEYQIASVGENMSISGKDIQVSRGGAEMILSFPEQRDGELYVYFQNLQFENGLATGYTIWTRGMAEEKNIGTMVNSISGLTNISHMYGGKHNWLLNLGYIPEKVEKVRIIFSDAGHYSMDDLVIYRRSAADIEKNIANLNRNVSSVQFSPNQMQASFKNDEPEYLFVSVPWSEGWKAEDHGKPVEVLKADRAFMALKLEPGSHDIVFRYRTPLLIPAAVISLISLAAGFILLKYGKRKQNAAKA